LIERVIAEVAAVADALDPDGRLPFAVTGSIGGRLAQRLPAALQARQVEPAGGPLDGAIELARCALGWPPGVPAPLSAASDHEGKDARDASAHRQDLQSVLVRRTT
jgi:hypothetical protein